jgi:hypothetical protein
VRSGAAFEAPHRRYHLLRGPVGAARESTCSTPFDQSANLWWPDDRAWCVASEIDLNSTYVGCGAACRDAILARTEFEAYAIDPASGITYDSDTLNPLV